MRNFPDLASYLEVFELDGVHGTEPETWPLLRRLTRVDFKDNRDPRIVGFAHERPAAWLDALAEAAASRGKRLMSFKIFRHNMEIEAIERHVMPRRGLRVIMVIRKQIDSYVSWRKAVELGKWQGVDTTGVRLTLDADRFEEWLTLQERWYEHWRSYLLRRHLPCPLIRYEIDIDLPPERILRRFAAAAAQVGITLTAPAELTDRGIERQDRATSMVDKVTNWPAFSREIVARGLERRAFGYPLQGWS